MAATPSTMLPLGTPAPAFTLPDVSSGSPVTLEALAGPKGLLVVFLCAHCPYVHHVSAALAAIGRDYPPQGVGVVAITSNSVSSHPADAPEPTAKFARQVGWTFPVLYDESQDVAKAYTAACTPDIFLFGPELTLVYRGQMDDSRPGRGESTGADLRGALDALVGGRPVPSEQKPSIGCNIKWKPGGEPAYYK